MSNPRSAARNYRWYRLDNAAIIVPSTAHGADTRVFRLSCELTEDVDPAKLQQALDQTIIEFPHFNVVLRKGLFWYYFDSTTIRPVVTEDHLPACSAIYFPGRRNLLYRVTYYRRRINLEMFHALADGTGGFIFFRKLLINYLCLVHDLTIQENEEERSSTQDKTTDAFRRYYSRDDLKKAIEQTEKSEDAPSREQLAEMTGTRAYQIHQDRDLSMQCHCIEGTVSSSAFAKLASENGSTVGIFVVALFIQSILECMANSEQKYPIVISVPVNLRQFFPSETTRNFFGVINVSYNAKDYDGTLESILPKVRESFTKQLTPSAIAKTMNSYSALVHNVAVQSIPLFLKDLGISYFFRKAKQGTTATLSNIGRIKMPSETVPYIDRFSAFMATANMQICVSSIGDKMVFGAVTAYAEYDVLPHFFRKLTSLGLDVQIGTNDYDSPEMMPVKEAI